MSMLWMVMVAVLATADEPGLKPVDAGVVDVGPLGLSFRKLPLDFRKPLGFDRVYQMPSGKFARVSGALTAVFPRSRYLVDEEGKTLVGVPADTRFVIGKPGVAAGKVAEPIKSATAASHAAATASRTAVEHGADRVAVRVEPSRVAVPPTSPSEGVLTSEAYRVARVAALLAEAVAAE